MRRRSAIPPLSPLRKARGPRQSRPKSRPSRRANARSRNGARRPKRGGQGQRTRRFASDAQGGGREEGRREPGGCGADLRLGRGGGRKDQGRSGHGALRSRCEGRNAAQRSGERARRRFSPLPLPRQAARAHRRHRARKRAAVGEDRGDQILHIDGANGAAAGHRNVTDEVIDSALRYRVQAPMIDSLMKEIGIEGSGLAA